MTVPAAKIAKPRDVLPAPRKFTVSEYYRMAKTGILRPDDRVELLEGRIYTMSPVGNKHAMCVR